jgi:hypothetical protein
MRAFAALLTLALSLTLSTSALADDLNQIFGRVNQFVAEKNYSSPLNTYLRGA